MTRFEQLAKDRGIPFVDYTNDSLCYNDKIFADFYHMKKEGAELFSIKFANDFKQLLTKQPD